MKQLTFILSTSILLSPSLASAQDNSLSPGAIGGISAAIAVPIVMVLLRKIKTYQIAPSAPPLEVGVEQKFKKWEGIAKSLMLAYAVASGVLFWLFFTRVDMLIANLFEPAVFVLKPFSVIYALPALFGAILFSSIPLNFTLRKLMGAEDLRRLTEFSDRKNKINSEKLFRHMVYVITPVIVLAVLLSWKSYAVITPDNITIQELFSIHPVTYKLSEIKRIANVKSFVNKINGKIGHKRHYLIETADGNGIDFQSSVFEVPLNKQEQISEYISRQSGIAIEISDPYSSR